MSEDQQKPTPEQAPVPAAETPNLISFDEFQKLELRVAQIIEAERIENADKLLRLQVSLGEKGNRQVIAGIAQHFAPETLIGRKIVVVANLKPAKLRGFISEAMLLAAVDGSNLELVSPGDIIPAGATVR